MYEFEDIEETFERIDAHLSKSGFPYHYTGGLCVAVHSQPRMTQDIDVVVSIPLGKIPEFLKSLQGDYLVDDVLALQTSKSQRSFQAIDNETFTKIDFYLSEAVPGQFTRIVKKPMLGQGIYPTLSKEDAIVMKVLWYSKGSGKSEQDVSFMLNAPEPFDLALVENLCEQLDSLDHYNRIRKKIEDGGIL